MKVQKFWVEKKTWSLELTNKLIVIILLLSTVGMVSYGHSAHTTWIMSSLGHLGLLGWALLSICVGGIIVVSIVLPSRVILVVLLVVLGVVGTTRLRLLRLLLTTAPVLHK